MQPVFFNFLPCVVFGPDESSGHKYHASLINHNFRHRPKTTQGKIKNIFFYTVLLQFNLCDFSFIL